MWKEREKTVKREEGQPEWLMNGDESMSLSTRMVELVSNHFYLMLYLSSLRYARAPT